MGQMMMLGAGRHSGAAVVIPDAYAINGFSPDTVADFVADYYRTNGNVVTFDTMFGTPTRTSLATMFNSAGQLVYNSHNLISYSENLIQWTNSGTTDSGQVLTANSGTGVKNLYESSGYTQGPEYVLSVRATAGTHNYICITAFNANGHYVAAVFDLSDGTVGQTATGSTSGTLVGTNVIDNGDGSYTCQVIGSANGGSISAVSFAEAKTGNTFDSFGNASWVGAAAGTETMTIHWAMVQRYPVVNSTYVETTGSSVYLPRRGHHLWGGISWKHEGIAHETEARTNLEINSENPAAGALGNNAATWASGATDPFGGTDAYQLRGNASTDQHYRSFNNAGISYVSGENYVLSVWIKAAGAQRYVSLGLSANRFSGSQRYVLFDLQTGAVDTEETNTKGFVEDFGNGYYRLTTRATASSNGTDPNSYFVVLSNASGQILPSYAGSTSDGVDVYGFDVAQGDFPSSHIPTNGATVTRTADSALTIPAAQLTFPGQSGSVSMHLSGKISYADNTSATEASGYWWNASGSNHIRMSLESSGVGNDGRWIFDQDDGTVGDFRMTSADNVQTPGVNDPINVASRHSATANEMNHAVNGAAATSIAVGSNVPDLSTSDITIAGQSNGYNGSIKQFTQWNDDIADAGIEEASTPDIYTANGFIPDTVADFVNDYYRAKGADVTFDTLFNSPTRSSLATMINSSGQLVYGPHNFVGRSQRPQNWAAQNTTESSGLITASVGTFSARLEQASVENGLIDNTPITLTARVTKGTHRYIHVTYWSGNNNNFIVAVFDLESLGSTATQTGGGSTSGSVTSTSMNNVTGDTWDLSLTGSLTNISSGDVMMVGFASAATGNTFDTRGRISSTWAGTETYTFVHTSLRLAASPDEYVETDDSTPAYGVRRGNYVYSGSAWVDQGIAIETEARTNIVTYSNDFALGWSEGIHAAPVTQDQTDPWGNANSAWRLVDDNAGGNGASCHLNLNITVSTSTTYCFSAYVKADQLSFVRIGGSGFSTPATGGVYFNLSTGAIGTATGGFSASDAFIEDVGNGWYRCAVVFTTDAADTAGALRINVADGDGDNAVDRDGTSSILVYGAQFEAGDFPSTYIPTNGATVTRTADDVPTIPTAQMAIPATSGGVSAQINGTFANADNNIDAGLVEWIKTNNQDYITLRLDDGAGGSMTVIGTYEFGNTGTTSPESLTDYEDIDINVPFNVAARWNTTGGTVAKDGVAGTEATHSNGAISDFTGASGLVVGGSPVRNAGSVFMGNINQAVIWSADIADAGIQEATT